MESVFVITIDGPAASGKSTVARKLARKLGLVHLNSGALYRALALLARNRGIELTEDRGLSELARSLEFCFELSGDGATGFFVVGEELGAHIWTQEVGELASRIAVLPMVREVMGNVQLGAASGRSVVVEGRDAGTVVFPDADFKFYLDATVDVRASRRVRELEAAEIGKEQKNSKISGRERYEEIRRKLEVRDHRDSNRELAPQMPASNAIIVDTSSLGVDEVVNNIYETITHAKDCFVG